MDKQKELQASLDELQRITGLKFQMAYQNPEEIDDTLQRLRQLSGAYKEKYNKNYFLQGLMEGNISAIDAQVHAEKLHINLEETRLLFLIETKSDAAALIVEILKGLFPLQNKNYIVQMNNHSVVLLRPCKCKNNGEEARAVADTIVDTVNAEAMSQVHVSCSALFEDISELKEVYQSAELAMRIGTLFYPEQMVISYSKMGTGRLIYQLPVELCEDYLHEIFGTEVPDRIDEETQVTINKFFRYNLNIAETSRQLHMHRNTLIYRIEQIEKRTGLDIRRFEDAMTFKIAMMVINYLDSRL